MVSKRWAGLQLYQITHFFIFWKLQLHIANFACITCICFNGVAQSLYVIAIRVNLDNWCFIFSSLVKLLKLWWFIRVMAWDMSKCLMGSSSSSSSISSRKRERDLITGLDLASTLLLMLGLGWRWGGLGLHNILIRSISGREGQEGA